jgi:transcriptional regulator with XRE-family HTH domain
MVETTNETIDTTTTTVVDAAGAIQNNSTITAAAETKTSEPKNSESEQIDGQVKDRQRLLALLHSKGLTQQEMANMLGISQSTVSRELKSMIKHARKKLYDFLDKESFFEYHRWKTGIDEAIKLTWQVAAEQDAPAQQRLRALEMLIKYNRIRLSDMAGLYSNIDEIRPEKQRRTKPEKYSDDIADYGGNST